MHGVSHPAVLQGMLFGCYSSSYRLSGRASSSNPFASIQVSAAVLGGVCWGLPEAGTYCREQLRILAISALLVLPVNVIKTFFYETSLINSLEFNGHVAIVCHPFTALFFECTQPF